MCSCEFYWTRKGDFECFWGREKIKIICCNSEKERKRQNDVLVVYAARMDDDLANDYLNQVFGKFLFQIPPCVGLLIFLLSQIR